MKFYSPRRVRMWHWTQCLRNRKIAYNHRMLNREVQAIHYDKIADRHISCVQQMNDLPGLLYTTAEFDCAEDKKQNKSKC